MTQFGTQMTHGTREGDVIAGKYRVEKLIGSGGMGFVFAAHHIHLDQKVAIKCILPEILGNPEAVSRFRREAQAAVRITSEHVARVFDVGTLDNGAAYMVMEYLDGGDLGAWLEQKGVLLIEQAVEFILQTCEAIAEAHSLGIVHRDLKPANIFCIRRPDGVLSAKVLDFGISKVGSSNAPGSSMDMTRTNTMVGSPYYMSPEQLRSSRDVDQRTDIWSLGVILYQLLTGQVPFSGEALPELTLKIVHDPTPSVRTARPDVPQDLDAVISKCLEKDRDQRYANIAELAFALVGFGPKRSRASLERVRGIIQSSGMSVSALALPPSSDARAEPRSDSIGVGWGHTARPAAGAKKWITLGILGVVAALGIAGFSWTKARVHSSSAPDISTTIAAAALQPGAASIATLSAASAETPGVARTAVEVQPNGSVVLTRDEDAGVIAIVANPALASGTKSKSEKAPKATALQAAAPAPVKPAPPASSKANCKPNYTLDSEGRKHFKPECFK